MDRPLTRAEVGSGRAHRLRVVLWLNLAIVVVQIVAGIAAHSLGLLADAGHNLTDVAAVGTSLLAVRWAMRKPSGLRSFGYHRGTVLAALFNAASIIVVTVVIGFEGIRRLIDPPKVEGAPVVVVALVAAVVNGFAARLLSHRGHDHAHGDLRRRVADLNMRSAWLHMIGDTLASLGVAVAGGVIWLTDRAHWLDPAMSLAIGALIAFQAVRLSAQAVDVLLESTPSDIDVADLTAFIAEQPGVTAVHDLHVWSLSSDVRALSAHLVLTGEPTLLEAQAVGEGVKRAVGPRFSIAHSTFELESAPCVDDDPSCVMHDDHAHLHGH